MLVYWGCDLLLICFIFFGKFFICVNLGDSVLVLRGRCFGKESCIVIVDDKYFNKEGNYCLGIDKYVLISYRC